MGSLKRISIVILKNWTDSVFQSFLLTDTPVCKINFSVAYDCETWDIWVKLFCWVSATWWFLSKYHPILQIVLRMGLRKIILLWLWLEKLIQAFTKNSPSLVFFFFSFEGGTGNLVMPYGSEFYCCCPNIESSIKFICQLNFCQWKKINLSPLNIIQSYMASTCNYSEQALCLWSNWIWTSPKQRELGGISQVAVCICCGLLGHMQRNRRRKKKIQLALLRGVSW